MTYKKAIKMLDMLIEAHLKNSKGLRELIQDWKSNTQGLGEGIASIHEDVAACLVLIKKEIIPNCKHPKNMRDGKPGHRYCMNCNWDMDD